MLTILGASAAALLAAIVGLRRRRRAHEPRAIALVLALPPAPPTLLEQVMRGEADLKGGGMCAWCRGPWEPCSHGCIRGWAPRRSPIVPIPGPVWRRSG